MATQIPSYERYISPTLQALHQLGASATVSELLESVAASMKLTDAQLNVPHNLERGNQSEVAYRMGWARTYLKKAGLIENSERGVWALTPEGRNAPEIDVPALVRQVKQDEFNRAGTRNGELDPTEASETDTAWRIALSKLLHEISPPAFERLCQRVLRECGFVEVEVTGRSGDGGIDGTGILRLHHVVSFQVLFQCKRWKGSVGSKEIRDFRGAMAGRTDKGLFMTTSTFTQEARKEAHRDGTPAIDLIDGDQLLDLLKSLGLGVKSEQVEKVTIDQDWIARV